MKPATLCLLFPLLHPVLPAQQMVLASTDSRSLRMFDVADLVAGAKTEPAAADAPGLAESRRRVAAFLGRFLEPALRPGDDVQILGGRWLAVLGSPEQLASAERLLTTARTRRQEHLVMQMHLLELRQPDYAAHVEGMLPKAGVEGGVRSVVLSKASAADLLAVLTSADINWLEAPKVLAAPLNHVTMSVGEDVAYVKDFNVKVSGQGFVADPIVDKVFDGMQIELLATYTGKDLVGMQCSFLQQKLEKPIPVFETTAPGTTAKIALQLPRTTGVRFEQTAELALGSTVLIAAAKSDGSWLVAMVSIDRSPQ